MPATGTPRNMQHSPRYEDLVAEISSFLEAQIAVAESRGLPREFTIVDPGFGFGKTPEHNLEMLRRLGEFAVVGRPLLIGTSRKSTLGAVLGGAGVTERLEATAATVAIAIANGTAYGLSSAVCTNRLDYVTRFVRELNLGSVNVWEVPGYRLEVTPFGGIKDSGYGSEGVAAKALRLGALGYLIKPFTAEEVLATVEKALTMGRLVRERASLSALVDRQTRYLQALSTLSQALVNSTDCDLLLQRIVDAAQYMTRADSSWLSLRQDEGTRFRVVAQRGKTGCTSLEFCETSGSENVSPVLTQGTPVRTRAASGTTIRLQTEDEAKALLQMPLCLPEVTLGLLSVDRRESDVPFSEQDQELLQILASYVLLALERNRQPGQGAESTR